MMSTPTTKKKAGPLPLAERLRLSTPQWHAALHQLECDLRVACPGIIQSFDASTQTATVQLALREAIILTNGTTFQGEVTNLEIPILPDVPVVIVGGGGYSVTHPVQAGDECLVIFADMGFDFWWQSGGTQNQAARRRHDLSDGIAVVGLRNQTRVLSNYSQSSIQLRTDSINSGGNGPALPSYFLDVMGGQVSVSGNLHALLADSTTVTTPTGQVLTFLNGQLINSSLTGILNTKFFTAAIDAVNACNACQDLQRIVNEMFQGINPVLAQISTQIALLAPLLSIPTGIDSVISWITSLIEYFSGPNAILIAQLTAMTAQIAELTAAVTAKAEQLGGSCSITIPT